MPARRRLPLLAAALAASLLLSGCSFTALLTGNVGGDVERGTVTTHTDEPVAAQLKPFYTQSLTWEPLGGRVDETRITVPLDWDDPAGETIEIAVARHHASASEPLGSLLINPGGPGGSGYDFVRNAAPWVVTNDVLARYDLIGFDPRGVNESTPVVCYTDPADQDARLYATYDAPYGSEEWLAELTRREADWTQACADNTGALLGNIDAASVARDMDVIRAVLGDASLHYLGYSYGTYLGAMYAELFPEKVGRMVLDGAVDPLVGDLEALATQMAGFDGAFLAYAEECVAAHRDCPLPGPGDAAGEWMRGLLASIDGMRLVAPDGRELDSATAGTAIAYTLYSESSWPGLTRMLNDLEAGDAASAFANADAYNGRRAGGYPDNSGDVYAAVTCVEGTLGTDGVTPLEGLAVIDERAPILGRYIAYDDYAVLDVACSNWPTPVAELPAEFDAAGAPPILVIGTTNDPATPYANAVSLAGQLSGGVLITYDGEGHTIYANGVACIDDTVDAYLLDDVVPNADPMC